MEIEDFCFNLSIMNTKKNLYPIPMFNNKQSIYDWRTSLCISRKDFLKIIDYNFSDESLRTWEYGIYKPPDNFIKDVKNKSLELTDYSDKIFYDAIRRNKRVPSGTWNVRKRRKDALKYVTQKEGYIKVEDFYQIKTGILKKYGVYTGLISHYDSLIDMLNDLIDDIEFLPWLFDIGVPDDYYDSEEHIIKYLKWFEELMNINKPEDWYNVHRRDIVKNKGSRVFKVGIKIIDLAKLIHPNYDYKPWFFNVTTGDFRFEDKENMKRFVTDIATSLGYDYPDDYYKLDRDNFGKHNNQIKAFYGGYIEMLKTIFPEINWHPWLFKRTPNDTWHNDNVVIDYVIWLGKRLGIKTMKEWYEITTSMIIANLGEGCLFQTGEEQPSRNIFDLVSLAWPEKDWDESRFAGISKQQRRLYRLLKIIYPNEKLLFNKNYEWLKNPKTNYWLELDFYFPELGFAIEHQGEQHFRDVDWFFNRGERRGSFKELKERDMLKIEICKKRKIKLIHTDYTWDGRKITIEKILTKHEVL